MDKTEEIISSINKAATGVSDAMLELSERMKELMVVDLPKQTVLGTIDFNSGDLKKEADVTNSGNARTTLTQQPDLVHSGQFAARLYSAGGPGAGTRIKQEGRAWSERDNPHNLPTEGYYSAWLLIPEPIRGRCNIWQWKYAKQLPDGHQTRKFLYALLINPDRNLLIIKTRVNYEGQFFQAAADILKIEGSLPVGKYFHLEAFYRWSEQPNGKIIFWLNGEEIIRIEDIITQFADMAWLGYPRQWTVNNYHPANDCVIYCDSMTVSTGRMGPTL